LKQLTVFVVFLGNFAADTQNYVAELEIHNSVECSKKQLYTCPFCLLQRDLENNKELNVLSISYLEEPFIHHVKNEHSKDTAEVVSFIASFFLFQFAIVKRED